MSPFAEQLLDLLQDKQPRTPREIVREFTVLRANKVEGIPEDIPAAVSRALVELQSVARIKPTDEGWKWMPVPQAVQKGLF